ncbi:L-lactate permease [Streptomyces sp. NPDC091040]|uniref:L-lactate permease n=1 Tax=Streptomyces sp. NPDC091040 TaxID=3365972 RepID=UPI0037F2320C
MASAPPATAPASFYERTAVMLPALGLPPVKAAVTVLLANTAPVAFGTMAIPVTTAGNLTGIPPEDIASVIGRRSPLLAIFVPLLLLFVVDGTRGIRQLWPIALVTGGVFALTQFWCANHFAYEVTDVVASLVGFGVAVLMLRSWKPRTPDDQRHARGAGPRQPEDRVAGPLRRADDHRRDALVHWSTASCSR